MSRLPDDSGPALQLSGGQADERAAKLQGPTVPYAAPVRRIDAPALRDAILAAGGPRLALLEPLPGGAVGAWKIRWPDGHLGVLTWAPPPNPDEDSGRPSEVIELVETARRAGVPVPRYEAAIDVGQLGTALLQELARGELPKEMTAGLVQRLIELAEIRRGLLSSSRPSARPMELYLAASGPGFCLHEPLRTYSRRSATLLERIEDIAAHEEETASPSDVDHWLGVAEAHLGL